MQNLSPLQHQLMVPRNRYSRRAAQQTAIYETLEAADRFLVDKWSHHSWC